MMRNQKCVGKKIHLPKMKLGLPDLDQAKAAVLSSLRSPESQRSYQHSVNLLRGIVPNPAYPSTGPLSLAIAFISKLANWPREPSTCDLPQCVAWLMRLPIPGC